MENTEASIRNQRFDACYPQGTGRWAGAARRVGIGTRMSGRQAHVRLWELYHLAARDNMIAMRIIAIEQDAPGADERGMAGHLREEALAAWRLKQRGVLRDIWFTAADNRAVLMLECRDEAEAQEIIATLPLVRHGFIAFQTMALRAYDGFERLFSEDIRAKILGA